MPPSERPSFRGAHVAPYDPAWRYELRIDSDTDSGVGPRRLDVETGTDGVVRFERIGVLHVPDVGTLDVWWLQGYGGGLFVPVRDALAGERTYGGGRYLLDTVKGADLGRAGDDLVIDFNFAYQPSCAYDPAWACPLAPAGNVVAVPVPAGELVPVS